MASSTSDKYVAAFNHWVDYRTRGEALIYMRLETPAEIGLQLAAYAAYLCDAKHNTADTAKSKLSSVKWCHLHDAGVALGSHKVVTDTLAALHKQSTAVQHKQGVFLADMLLWWPHVQGTGVLQENVWRAILLAFHMLLRASEYLAADLKGTVDAEKCLLVGGVRFVRDGADLPLQQWKQADHARLLLRASKTDQQRVGSVLVLSNCGGSRACPVRALAELMLAYPPGVQSADLLMTVLRKGAQSVIHRRELMCMVKHMVAAQGRPTEHVGTHAMRVGGATTLAHAKMPDRLIKLAGRWKSDAYRIYIKDSLGDFLRVTAVLSTPTAVTREVIMR